jgi:hypothetical protein
MNPPSSSSGLKTISGLIILNIVPCTQLAGMTNTWGNIVLYIASYLHIYDPLSSLSNLTIAYPAEGLAWSTGLGMS